MDARGERPLSALPSRSARALAFVAIVLGGAAGGAIGRALVQIQCTGDCTVPAGIGLLVGSVGVAAGMAVVAVLVLRALGEWRQLGDGRG
ncbi:MAG: hypothetical protein EBU70_06275 [Actinobacteria bacterium]|nr:hypothetical protein [Actinomycetota bacterium]